MNQMSHQWKENGIVINNVAMMTYEWFVYTKITMVMGIPDARYFENLLASSKREFRMGECPDNISEPSKYQCAIR